MIGIYEEIGEPSRRSILRELTSGPKSVSELVSLTGLKQPNVSNHLAKLKSRGILSDVKSGRVVYYSFASDDLWAVADSVLASQVIPDSPFDLQIEAEKFASAAIASDESTCLSVVDRAIKHKIPSLEIYEDLLAAAMEQVGNWYAEGKVDEAEEHLASEITLRAMARVVDRLGSRGSMPMTAVLGCASGTWHVIGLRMASDLLRLNGWRTCFLGANVPQLAFLAMVANQQPKLVLLSCVSIDSVESTTQLVQNLRDGSSDELLIGVGGPMAESHGDEFLAAGANFCTNSLRDFVQNRLPNIEKRAESVTQPA